jgi:phosphoribosylglycinamide formyltransferase-1
VTSQRLNGSNLQALLDAARAPGDPAQVVVVVSNLPGVFALERARIAGVDAVELSHRGYPDRAAYDSALCRILPGLLRPFGGRIINIHPALLPSFPGTQGVRQALQHGAKISGCTVHFVDEGTDTGPIIAQAAVPVLDSDDESSLSARIQAEEHHLLPRVVRWLAEGRVRVEGRRVRVDSGAGGETSPALHSPG